MNSKKLEQLKKTGAARKMGGGIRMGQKKKFDGSKDLNQVNQLLGTLFGKTPHVNVTNPVKCLRFRDIDGTEWRGDFKDEGGKGGASKIRYVKSAHMFLVDRRYVDDLEKVENSESGPTQEELPLPEVHRKGNHLERKFKTGIVKKIKAKKKSYVRACFELADQIWDLADAEVYTLGRHYYVIFGDMPERQEMTPEMKAKLQELIKEQSELNQQQIDGDEPPDLVEGSPNVGDADKSLLSPEPAVVDTGDNGGFEVADVEMVMNEGGVSRERAVEALRKTKGDMVDAIMELMS